MSDLHLGYLAVVVGYFVLVLALGLWGSRKRSYDAYTVAERGVNLPLSAGSFFATYVSSATVVGFVGYTTLHGTAIFSTYFWGFALGWITLALAGARMWRLKLRTVPELFQARFDSGALRSVSAVVIVVALAFSIMTQLVAGSLVLEVVVGIPQVTALVVLALVLVVYTVLGGLVVVVRTDFVQGGLIMLGVLAAFALVAWRLGPGLLDLEPARQDLFGGSVTSPVQLVAFVLVAWGGVAAQPYYLHRFYAAKDVRTARQMIGVGALLASVCYVAILAVGMGLPQLLPESQLGDSAMVEFGLSQGGLLGTLLLIGIICAVQSTVDSALHLVGVYTTEDIVVRLWPRTSERARLVSARLVTATLGLVTMAGAIYFVVSGGGFIVTLLNIWLGTLSSALLAPLYAAIFWRRATPVGALCSSIAGFLGYFLSIALTQFAGVAVPGHPIFYGLGGSVVLLVVVSLLTRPVSGTPAYRLLFGGERDQVPAEEVAR